MNNNDSIHPELQPIIRLCNILSNNGVPASLFYNKEQIIDSERDELCCKLWAKCAKLEKNPDNSEEYQELKPGTTLLKNTLCPNSHPVAVFSLFENMQLKVCTGFIAKNNSQPNILGESKENIEASIHQPAAISVSAIEDMIDLLKDVSLQNQRNNQEKEQLADALEKSFEEISLLHKIGDIVCLNQKPVDHATNIATDLSSVIECEKVLIFWNDIDCNSKNANYRPAVFQDNSKMLSSNIINKLWDIANSVIMEKANFKIENDFKKNTRLLSNDIHNYIITPIQGKDRAVGALVAINKTNSSCFTTVEARMTLSIANKLSNSHETQTLYLNQKELMMGTLRALVRSIDAKDPYTCGHSERVAIISKFLATEMKMPDQEIENTYMAGLLHDIGKIGIRGTTLRKDARLTNDEFEEIKKHPQIGAGILKGIKQISIVINGVLTHHERYDGKGYPIGLSGCNIPVIGRIVNIADTIDAMISTRPYRRSLPVSKVLCEISRFSGTQFDPKIAEIVLKSDINNLINMLNDSDNSIRKAQTETDNRLTQIEIPDISKQLSDIKYSDYTNYEYQLI